MKLKIEKIYRNEIDTSRGKSIQVVVQSDGRTYSAWGGKWNESWRPGDEIEVTVNQVAKGDKIYNNIVTPKNAPRESAPAIDFGPFIEAIQQDQRKILSHLYTIEGLVRSLVKGEEKVPPPPPEDVPPHTDEDNPGDPIPF